MINMSEEKQPVPEYDMSIQHTHFRKGDTFAHKEFGKKIVDAEGPHWDVIGQNKSICKKLYGFGGTLNDLGLGFRFTEFDNHVWLAQPNLKSKDRLMHICLNCGSLKLEGKFVPYTELKQ